MTPSPTSFRSWPILVMAFGCLLAIVTASGFQTTRRARRIYDDVLAVRQARVEAERSLSLVQSELIESAIVVRDYLLDRSPITADAYRHNLVQLRQSIAGRLDLLEREMPEESRGRVRELRHEVDAYWESMRPLFAWTPVQRLALSSVFLETQVLPRRKTMAAITRELRDLNEANVRLREAQVEWAQRDYRRESRTNFIATGVILLLIALASIAYITRLERQWDQSRLRTEAAEAEMRSLSRQLVQAQEEERRSLSRELHDDVGQLLTGLKIEVGNLERAHARPGAFDEARQLADRAMQSVRGIAMGLRPSMLDDLGLEAALSWQAREASRRTGVPVTFEADGALNDLPDAHRTAIYRVVQEALTNAARHAQAKSIRILLHGEPHGVTLTVQDDGVGFTPAETRRRGLGLIGIEERVRQLGGSVTIRSRPGHGALLLAELPLERETA